MMYIYYVLAILKELLTHLLEAAVLQLRKTHFKCLGKKKLNILKHYIAVQVLTASGSNRKK